MDTNVRTPGLDLRRADWFGPLLSYVLMVAIGWLILSLLPPAWLFGESLPARLLPVIIAGPLHIYASYHTPHIVRAFRSVQAQRDKPQRLLTEGYYGRVRHPFYAMNMLAIFSLTFALASVYTLVPGLLAVALFTWNGFLDERKWLYPLFGEAYSSYTRKVPARYFTPVTGAYFALLLIASIAGLIL